VTLHDNVLHASLDGEAGDDTENDATAALTYTVQDADGSSANGTLTVRFDDDSPISFAPAAGLLTNSEGSAITLSLNTVDAIGADDFGDADVVTNVSFATNQEGDSGLTSDGLAINYYVSPDGKTLTASTAGVEGDITEGNTIFTVEIDDTNDEYTLTMLGTIDNGSGVSFEDLSGTGEAGNSSFKIVNSTSEDSGLEILFTPLDDASSINSDSDDVGVDNQFISSGEGLRVDFGKFSNDDKGTGTGNDDTFIVDDKATINGFRFDIEQVSGSSFASLTLSAFDSEATPDNDLSNDAQDAITRVDVFDGSGALVASWTGTDGAQGGITFMSSGGEVTVSGLEAGYEIATFTETGYDGIEIRHEDVVGADGQFSIGSLEVSQSDAGDPVDLTFDTTLTDADGDTASGTIEVTAAPADADILGTSGSDDLVGDSGDNFLFAGDGDDTLDGGEGDDILAGGGGNDTMTGGLGADVFVWYLGDQGSTADAADDTIDDFTLGEYGVAADADKLDVADLLDFSSGDGDAIGDFIVAAESSGDTVLHIKHDGGIDASGSNADQTITLDGVSMGGDTSSDFIQSLIDNGQLDIE
ncbi:type I secretion C-terminal target domain-containing protein, partial [Halomonas koreensis]